MYPLRSHLYELAQAREMELVSAARREAQLQQLPAHRRQLGAAQLLSLLWKRVCRQLGGNQEASDSHLVPHSSVLK